MRWVLNKNKSRYFDFICEKIFYFIANYDNR